MSIGTFHGLRELLLLDLADLPEIPSVFDEGAHPFIHPLRFLHAFAEDLAKPIAHGGHEHVEYVPTQIATEYFRRVFRTADGQALDGLIYRSSRNPGGRAVVLFCENEQCIDSGYGGHMRGKLLSLVGVEHEACPALA